MKIHFFNKKLKWYIILLLCFIQYLDYLITIPLVYLILFPFDIIIYGLKEIKFYFPSFKKEIKSLRKFEGLLGLITTGIYNKFKNIGK